MKRGERREQEEQRLCRASIFIVHHHAAARTSYAAVDTDLSAEVNSGIRNQNEPLTFN